MRRVCSYLHRLRARQLKRCFSLCWPITDVYGFGNCPFLGTQHFMGHADCTGRSDHGGDLCWPLGVGAVVLAAQRLEPNRPFGLRTSTPRDAEPEKPIVPTRKAEVATVLVINSKGEGVPNATVQVFELDLNSEIREYRTNDEGRCRVLVDARSRATELHAPHQRS